jgi:hypothetical protein
MTNLTQEEQILQALKNAGTMGVYPTYIIESLHIFQYSARINGLRKRFNCECKNGVHCCSSEHIINRRLPNGTTKFFYENTSVDWEKKRQEAIKERDTDPIINSDQMALI